MHPGVLSSEKRVLAAQGVARQEPAGKALEAARRGVQGGRDLGKEEGQKEEEEEEEEEEELCESEMMAWLEAITNKEVRPLA